MGNGRQIVMIVGLAHGVMGNGRQNPTFNYFWWWRPFTVQGNEGMSPEIISIYGKGHEINDIVVYITGP